MQIKERETHGIAKMRYVLIKKSTSHEGGARSKYIRKIDCAFTALEEKERRKRKVHTKYVHRGNHLIVDVVDGNLRHYISMTAEVLLKAVVRI